MEAVRRIYRQGARARRAAATRAAIVEAARSLLLDPRGEPLTLDGVASAAGVTRRTVYNQLGSRAGLLEALLDFIAARGKAHELAAAAEERSRKAALRTFLQRSTALWSSDRLVFRRLLAIAQLDAEVAAALAEREARRRRAAELALFGRAARGLTELRARAVLSTLSSFPVYDQLVDTFGDGDLPQRLAKMFRM